MRRNMWKLKRATGLISLRPTLPLFRHLQRTPVLRGHAEKEVPGTRKWIFWKSRRRKDGRRESGRRQTYITSQKVSPRSTEIRSGHDSVEKSTERFRQAQLSQPDNFQTLFFSFFDIGENGAKSLKGLKVF